MNNYRALLQALDATIDTVKDGTDRVSLAIETELLDARKSIVALIRRSGIDPDPDGGGDDTTTEPPRDDTTEPPRDGDTTEPPRDGDDTTTDPPRGDDVPPSDDIPTVGADLPTPPQGTVDPNALIASVATVQPTNIIAPTFTTQVSNGMQNTLFTNNGTHKGSHSILFAPGTGNGGVQAAKQAALTFRKNWIKGFERNDIGAFTRWGMHAYGPSDWLIEENYIFDVPDEHGFYWKSCYSFTFKRNVFRNIGSQGIQVVWRSHEAINFNDYMNPNGNGVRALAHIEDNVFIEIGQPSGGRPSYAVSLFEVQGGPDAWNDVIERDVAIQGNYFESKDFENKASGVDGYFSFGAIMVHGHQDVILDANTIRYSKPNRAVVQLWNCNNVTIRNNEIGDPWNNSSVLIDIRNLRGKLTVEGNIGNAEVQLATGSLYTPPIHNNLQVLYKGPITNDIVI